MSDHSRDAAPRQAERGLVVRDRATAVRLTESGVAATTYGDIRGQADETVRGYFADNEPAVVFVTPRSEPEGEATAARLRGLGIVVRIVRELLDAARHV